MATINLDEVAQILRDAGDETAEVVHTGGGCAAVFAGGVLGHVDGEPVYAVVVGPGTYQSREHDGVSVADTGDLWASKDSSLPAWEDDEGAQEISGSPTPADVARVATWRAEVNRADYLALTNPA